MLAAEHEGVRPDLVVLGKALSGGLYPVSAVAGSRKVLGLFRPGTHGSTYGGNPLACAIGMAALAVIERERLPQKAERQGRYFYRKLRTLAHPKLKEVRGTGLLLAVEFTEPIAKQFCRLLMENGVLAKDTHDTTVRFAPPLLITRPQIDRAFARIESALKDL